MLSVSAAGAPPLADRIPAAATPMRAALFLKNFLRPEILGLMGAPSIWKWPEIAFLAADGCEYTSIRITRKTIVLRQDADRSTAAIILQVRPSSFGKVYHTTIRRLLGT